MKKVVIWCRCSTSRQEIESQRLETERYAIELGYNKSDFVYIGSAGASAVKVNELYKRDINELYSLIENEQVKTVVVWSLNRLSRNDVIAMELKQKLITYQVQLHVKEPTITLLNSDGTVNTGAELAFSLFATMSKQQADELKSKAKRGKARNIENRLYNGGRVPYGYVLNGNKIEVDIPTSLIIKEAFETFSRGGISIRALAREYESRGISKLNFSALYKMLLNENYCNGKIYEPIISKQLFNKVQEVLQQNNVNIPHQYVNFNYCNKLLKCSCGANYTSTSKQYFCNRLNKDEYKHLHHDKNISVPHLDGVVLVIALHIKSKLSKQDISKEKEENLKQSQALLQKNYKMITDNQKVESKKERIKELYINGDITKSDYLKRKDKLELEYNENNIKILKYTLEIERLAKLRELPDVNQIFNTQHYIDNFDYEIDKQVNTIIKQVISTITYNDNQLTITAVSGEVFNIIVKKRNFNIFEDLQGHILQFPMIYRSKNHSALVYNINSYQYELNTIKFLKS